MRIIVVASIVLTTAACSGGDFDRRVNSADEHYMSALARELDAAGIAFRVPRDGSIVYRSQDDQAFSAIDERVKKQIAAGAAKEPSK